MNLGEILPRRLDLMARPALSIEDDDAITYRQLHDLKDRYASALRRSAVRQGDRVGIFLHNCVDYWALYLAVAAIGAIAVRINFRLSADELDYVLKDSGCATLVVHDTLLQTLGECSALQEIRLVVAIPEEGEILPEWAEPLASWLPPTADPVALSMTDDRTCQPHMIMYTSGTTGRPKGAVWTHKSTVLFGAMQLMQWGGSSDRVALTVGPLYHVGSMEDLLLPTLMSGGHAVMMRSRNFSLRRALEVARRLAVTDMLLFPAMVYELLEIHGVNGMVPGSLRTILTGGSPLVGPAVAKFADTFPGVALWSVYGLTEGGGISIALDPEESLVHPSAAGRPLPLAGVRISDEHGCDAKTGEVGEICLRGPNAAQGYWNRPEATAATFAEGWVRTGDLGRIDASGLLFVTGRAKDMIRTGDENVYASEVERVLGEHPAILDSAVIGVPDAIYGEAVCAVVVLRKGSSMSPADVASHCRFRMAGYKKPRYVAFIDELPRNATSKVVKDRLKDMLAASEIALVATSSDD